MKTDQNKYVSNNHQVEEKMKKAYEVMNEVNKVIIGKENIIKKVMATIIAGGHILLEDVPGVGKTTMAMAFSRAMDLDQTRMQFTPDVLPSDVVGYSIPTANGGSEYRKGAVMCNMFLADEINRTSPKTQSALLEVMEEGKVTVDGVTRTVDQPFIVMATQNPVGSAGTQLLPESQLDRFMVKLSLGYPDLQSEMNVLMSKQNDVSIDSINKIITKEELMDMREKVKDVYVNDEILMYVAKIAKATRENYYIKLGLSPRGSLALLTMSKAMAYLNNRDYVIPEDVRACGHCVMEHRLVLSTKAKVENISVSKMVDNIFIVVDSPRG